MTGLVKNYSIYPLKRSNQLPFLSFAPRYMGALLALIISSRLILQCDMQKILIASNSIAHIYRVEEAGQTPYIQKESADTQLLECEASMLTYLAPFVPVPEVLELRSGILRTCYIPNDGHCPPSCERAIADALAQLHNQSSTSFGFEYATPIGPFWQDNTPTERWIDFYRDRRVLDFANSAYQERAIDATLLGRIERFAATFDSHLVEPDAPALLHGNIWSGNVLCYEGQFSAFIDPALLYGHPEMELAFIEMFYTFGHDFYSRYREHREIAPDFFEVRAHIYRIFPYLVHIRAFGNSYRHGLETILKHFGY